MRALGVLLPLLLCAWPYRPVKAAVDAAVETRTFYLPGGAAQVEVNMAFLAGTMLIKMNDQGYLQTRVEVLTIIEQDGVVKAYGKTEVLGPERLDSMLVDMLHQEFFVLEPGSYDLTVEARDLNMVGDTSVMRYNAPLAVGAQPDGVSISDILFAERIEQAQPGQPSKYGYVAVPLITDYFPKDIVKFNFYAEIYGTDKVFGNDSLFLLTYQIESFEKKKVFGPFKRSMRVKGRSVEPVIAEFDIAQLPSGNYVLAIEVRNKQAELMARREQFFQRNNPIAFNYDLQSMDKIDLDGKFSGALMNVDTLADHVASLAPIADPLERKIIADRYKDRDLDLMQRFFYSFWANRSGDPEAAWDAYRAEVIKANKQFGCRLLKGYETDRGRVFLQYGGPNTMMDRFNEMGTLPYTIWHYYRAGQFTNRRFVFYQPELGNNCMQLLHSEVPGEVQNPQWNSILHQRNVAIPGVQTRQPGTLESDRVLEFFNDPR